MLDCLSVQDVNGWIQGDFISWKKMGGVGGLDEVMMAGSFLFVWIPDLLSILDMA
jgi:hypothetical protein